MPNRRIPTTWKCRWRPNRTIPRNFTFRDAARIACKVTRTTEATIELIVAEYHKICPSFVRRPQRAAEAVAEAQQVEFQIVRNEIRSASIALESANVELLETQRVWILLLALLRVIALIGLIVPIARPARISAVALQATIVARNAANAAIYRQNAQVAAVARERAANDAFWRRVSGL